MEVVGRPTEGTSHPGRTPRVIDITEAILSGLFLRETRDAELREAAEEVN